MAKPRVSCDSEKFCGAQVQEYRAIKGKTQKDTSKLDEGQEPWNIYFWQSIVVIQT